MVLTMTMTTKKRIMEMLATPPIMTGKNKIMVLGFNVKKLDYKQMIKNKKIIKRKIKIRISL
jgi:hypothetical protein